MSSVREIIGLIVIFTILIALYFIFVDKRPFTDEGSYCTIGQALADGSVLYRDIYNEKAPLPYFLAVPFVKGGEPIRALRTVVLFFNMVTVLLLYLMLRMNSLSVLSSLSITLFYILTAPLFQSFSYISETVALPIILFVVMQLYRDQKGHLNILAGFFSLLLIFIKQPFVIFSLLIMLAAARSPNVRGGFYKGVFLSIVFMSILFFTTELFMPFIENITFALTRYDIKIYSRPPYRIEYYQFSLMLGLFVLFVTETIKREIPFYKFIVVLSLLLPGIFRMDAFKLLPFFTLLLVFLAREKYVRGIRNLFIFLILLLLLSFGSVYQYRFILNQNFDSMKIISYYIQSAVPPEESIWVGPHEANIYCISHRRAASKYYFILPWIARPEVVQDIVEDLRGEDAPRCIVDVSQFNDASTRGLETVLPEFDSLVKDYDDVKMINNAIIYCKQ